MTQLTISMPPALQSWVDARLAQGRYADAAEYLRDLVRRDQELAEDDARWVRAMVEEGLSSGIVDAEPEDVLKEIMARIPHD
jgi:antitoxin ParD1/3/4